MIDDHREQLRAAVRLFAQAAGLSPTALARRAGLVPSTINRFLNSSAHPHVLSTRTLTKLMDAAGLRMAELELVDSTGVLQRQEAWMRGANQLRAAMPHMDDRPRRALAIVGTISDTPRAALELPRDLHEPAPISADPRYPDTEQFALRVERGTADLAYRAGAVVLCVAPGARALVQGTRAVLLRRVAAGAVVAELRELRASADGALWWWPLSSDPRRAGPIQATDGGLPAPKVASLAGVVAGSWQPE